MIFVLRIAAVLALFLGLTACAGSPKIAPEERGPALVMEEFFEGRTEGSGVFINSLTGSERRFDVVIVGTWDGTVLTLVEDFFYEDGETDQKTWRLTKTGPGSYTGTREDVVGEATGTQDGDVFRLKYKVELGGLTVRFNDVLGLVDETTLINRAVVSKWGVRVGRVDLTLNKVEG